jgi:predicted dehydrogenase
VPFVYRYHPLVREARARVLDGVLGRVRLIHGSYLQDWLSSPADNNWRVDVARGGPSRAFADIGSHWCDLVEFVSAQRITRLVAQTAIAVPERVDVLRRETPGVSGEDARVRVETEDIATLLFSTDGSAPGSVVISQAEPGRRNRLWFEIGGEQASVAFNQEEPETLWVGRRDGIQLVPRDPTLLSHAAARYATLPSGHPQGYRDCFDGFVADAYAAVDGWTPEGLPTIADGLRAVRLSDAMLRSSRDETWTGV